MSKSGGWEALAIVGVAALFSALSAGNVCLNRRQCVDDTCSAVDKSSAWPTIQCSFLMNVPLISDIVYHQSNASGTNLASLTRGYCAVGERLHLSAITNEPVCMLLRPFPNALDHEVMDPSASSDHEKACGAWLAGGLAVQTTWMQQPEYLAFDDGAERAAAVRAAEAAQYAGVRHTNLGKFRAACQRAVLGGTAALRSAGVLAYAHLVAAVNIDAVSDEDSALHAVGMLTSFYCDSPVLLGWELASGGFKTSVRRGVSFSTNAMAQALEIVGAHAYATRAEQGNAYVELHAWSSPPASIEQLTRVLQGGTGRADNAKANLTILQYTPELDGFVLLLNDSMADARAYLHGVAAMCAFSIQASVDNIGYTAHGAAGKWLRETNAQRPAAAALGQLKPPANREPLFEVEHIDVTNASTITLSQLVGASADKTGDQCLNFTRHFFPDSIDSMHFDLVISPTLYERMKSITQQVRHGVARALRNDTRIRAALTDPDAIAADVEAVRIRIPGAPRNSWAGAGRAIPSASFESDDGIFVQALKQARTVWLDRQSSLAYDSVDICDGPAAFGSLTQNAYIFPSYRCSYMLLGLSFRPWADELYNDASLVSRWGYIIAHELAHSALNTPYQSPGVDDLLADYPCASTRDESFADILSVLGVVETGLVDSATLCQDVSQLWCARTPVGYGGCVGRSHPRANVRGDAICATMRRLGV